MKHFGLSISLLLLGGFISSISSQELESRLKFYKPDKFRAAVHSLQQKYKTTSTGQRLGRSNRGT